MFLSCLIVEDEPLALKRVREYVGQLPYLGLLASFDSAVDALNFLKTNRVDIIFLDIEMDGLSGIDFIQSLSFNPQIIITTAYDKYALKGFELHVADYLLKPFSFERFQSAVGRVAESISKNKSQDKDCIFVKTEYRLERLALSDIYYVEGMGDYRNIQTAGKKILTLMTFTELEKELPASKFCRVHKSYMVSVDKIISIERSRIRILNTLIPVSDSYKASFFGLIGVKSDT